MPQECVQSVRQKQEGRKIKGDAYQAWSLVESKQRNLTLLAIIHSKLKVTQLCPTLRTHRL